MVHGLPEGAVTDDFESDLSMTWSKLLHVENFEINPYAHGETYDQCLENSSIEEITEILQSIEQELSQSEG